MADDWYPEALAMSMNAGDAKRAAREWQAYAEKLKKKLDQAIGATHEWRAHCEKLQARVNALQAENQKLAQAQDTEIMQRCVPLVSEAAGFGSASAQLLLADMYINGCGVEIVDD